MIFPLDPISIASLLGAALIRDYCSAACPDCTRAAKVLWHGFRSGCKGCQARAVSRGVAFHDAKRAGDKRRPAYRQLLDGLGLTHAQVLEAAKNDAINRRNA